MRLSPAPLFLHPATILCVLLASVAGRLSAEESLHAKIDQTLAAAHPGGEAPLASDAEFLRRCYLVLTGVIPTVEEVRAFLADPAADKRAQLVDRLFASGQYVRWMAVKLDVMLMERRAEKHVKAPEWVSYLEGAVAANKPWDALVRELLCVDGAMSAHARSPVGRWNARAMRMH